MLDDLPDELERDGCPWAEELPAYLQGELPAERALDVSEHLDGCESCRFERDELRGLLCELDALEPADAHPEGRDLSERVLSAIARVVLTPFRHLGPAGFAWTGMAAASIVLLLLVRGPLAPAPRQPPPPAPVAVAEAAGWLLRAQEPDGSWDPARWGGRERWRVGLSGLALSAVMEAPDEPGQHPALDRAVAYLVREQAANGRIGPSGVDHLYNHAPATLALQRVIARHPVPELEAAVCRGVDYVVAAQSPQGGWGYADGPDAPNTVISGWPFEVLCLARAAGRDDLEEPIERARRWFSSMADATGRMGYDRPGAFPQGVSTPTAVGVGLDSGPPWPDDLAMPFDLLAVYFLARNPANEGQRERLRRRLASLQVRSGAHAGSFRAADRWAADGGRLYATAVGLLAWSRL